MARLTRKTVKLRGKFGLRRLLFNKLEILRLPTYINKACLSLSAKNLKRLWLWFFEYGNWNTRQAIEFLVLWQLLPKVRADLSRTQLSSKFAEASL